MSAAGWREGRNRLQMRTILTNMIGDEYATGKPRESPMKPTPHPTPDRAAAGDLPTTPPGPRRLDSRDLFGEASVVLIAHDGEVYALRRTRLGKLILTK